MDWKAIEALTGLACAIAALVAGYFALSLRSAIETLRTEIAEARTKDSESRVKERDELKTWINGSFMRAKIVEAEISGMDSRVERIENRCLTCGAWRNG
jgi:hypothetical protein